MDDMILRGKYDAKVVNDFGFVPKRDDLISRAWVLAEYDRQHQGPPGGARKIMVEAPTVDAVPVVHGRWVADSDGLPVCSVCGEIAMQRLFCDTMHGEWRYDVRLVKTPFCPSCGAKMDGERRDKA